MQKVVAAGAAVLALCALARYRIMEVDALVELCAAGDDWRCTARALLPQLFIEQRLGWFALVTGSGAFVLRSRRLAWAAWLAGLAGMILYCVDFATVGAVLALLVLARDVAGVARPV